MLALRRLALGFGWAVALALGSGSAAGDPPQPTFAPDAGAPGAMRLSRSTFEERGPGYTARLQKIDATERQAYLRQVTGWPVDPFASNPDQPERYLTFLIEIVNSSKGSLVFQPQNCWLVTNQKEVIYPIGLEGLRTAYGLVGQEMAPAYERAKTAVLEDSRTLDPEQRLSGLLVYPAPKPRTKRYAVDLQFATADGEVVRLKAHYRRVKPGEKD